MPRRSTGSSSTKPTGSTKNSSRGFGNPLFATLKGLAVLLMLLSACITWKLISSEQQHTNNGGSMIPRELCSTTTTTTTGSMSKLGSGDDMCQKEYQRVTSNRTKGITRDDLERSRALVGNRYRLAMLAKTLKERKRPITGVVCGGSISLGHGVVP
ncbi:expressed unknown protein [Seminavis robusta]|uniref:Uncharacterized protein n=1 Tax=Seminavis robusta TaxID=568900 RepID=A0A9N8HXL3_9STRA|nr:expressed unknown protein [Seminavis robusta]|eukprot:Sro3185_g344860.1 n/a (156) ;mRNA; f:3196-3663